MSNLPLVYVETNWIIASVLKHDEHHHSAVTLLQEARNGVIELRIPNPAVLESRKSVGNAASRLFKAIEDVRNAAARAYRNGVTSLNAVDTTLASSDVFNYTRINLEHERATLLSDPAIHLFGDAALEIPLAQTLVTGVSMDQNDIKDFYILVSIVADRDVSTRLHRPAMFFSTNKKEFMPGKKLASDFFANHRMIWRPDFNFVAGQRDWTNAFGASIPTP